MVTNPFKFFRLVGSLQKYFSYLLDLQREEVCYLNNQIKSLEAKKAKLFFTCYERILGDFKMSCSLNSTDKFESTILNTKELIYEFLGRLAKALNTQVFIDFSENRGYIFKVNGEREEVIFSINEDNIFIE